MAPRIGYRQPQAGGQGFARTMKVFGGPVITLVTADVQLNAQVAIARVPKGFVVLSGSIIWGACDSGAALSMSVGDVGNTARLLATNTTCRAGGTVALTPPATVGFQYTDDTDIILNATAGAAGGIIGATPTAAIILQGYMGP